MIFSFMVARPAAHRTGPRPHLGLRLVGALLVSLGMLVSLRTSSVTTLVAAASPLAADTPQMPLYLEKNIGQAPRGGQYVVHAGGRMLFLTDRGAVRVASGRALIRTTPVAAALHPEVVAADKLPGILNYFIGSNPKHWYANIPTYGQVTYRNVYPGIDLRFYGQGEQLEYDWVVRPGANPGRIRLAVGGSGTPSIDTHGALHLGTVPLLETRPTIYQRVGGMQRVVAGGYVLEGKDMVRFRVGPYDESRPLVIDPVILFAQYVDGFDDDTVSSVKLDARGNIYMTGDTDSPDFPTENAFQAQVAGAQDMYVMKLSPSGELQYSTFIGGRGYEYAYGLAIDGEGQAYVAGNTASTNFPQVPQEPFPGGSAAVVLSLTSQGNALRYSTLVGEGVGFQYSAEGIALDAQGDAYVPLEAYSTGKGDPHMYLLKVDRDGPGGSANVLAGLGGDWLGDPAGIAVMKNGDVVVAGATATAAFPTSHATQAKYGGGTDDAFVTVLAPSLKDMVFSTFLGGSGDDDAYGLALDGSNNIYVTGYTRSPDFPHQTVIGPVRDDGPFVTKLSNQGRVLYSSIIGTPKSSYAYAIGVNKRGYATIGGEIDGGSFPLKHALKGQGSYRGGDSDGFVATLGGAGKAILFSSYLGGSGADYVSALAISGSGNLFAAGSTKSADFPTTRGDGFNPSGKYDGFLVKIGNHP